MVTLITDKGAIWMGGGYDRSQSNAWKQVICWILSGPNHLEEETRLTPCYQNRTVEEILLLSTIVSMICCAGEVFISIQRPFDGFSEFQ
jgi:hypothetical protein